MDEKIGWKSVKGRELSVFYSHNVTDPNFHSMGIPTWENRWMKKSLNFPRCSRHASFHHDRQILKNPYMQFPSVKRKLCNVYSVAYAAHILIICPRHQLTNCVCGALVGTDFCVQLWQQRKCLSQINHTGHL